MTTPGVAHVTVVSTQTESNKRPTVCASQTQTEGITQIPPPRIQRSSYQQASILEQRHAFNPHPSPQHHGPAQQYHECDSTSRLTCDHLYTEAQSHYYQTRSFEEAANDAFSDVLHQDQLDELRRYRFSAAFGKRSRQQVRGDGRQPPNPYPECFQPFGNAYGDRW